MLINRKWGMPSRWTFQIPPVADLLARYVGDGKGWIDPFAGMSSLAEVTNDLNPDRIAKYHLDALPFLTQLEGHYKGALIDPPYSPRQVKECYDSIGQKMFKTDAMLGCIRGKYKAVLNVLLDPGAIVITCGWNSVGMGKELGFELIEILLVCHGSDHNDTIVTVERKLSSVMDLSASKGVKASPPCGKET